MCENGYAAIQEHVQAHAVERVSSMHASCNMSTSATGTGLSHCDGDNSNNT